MFLPLGLMETSVESGMKYRLFAKFVSCRLFRQTTGMRRRTTFRSTTDRIYDGGPIYYNIIL